MDSRQSALFLYAEAMAFVYSAALRAAASMRLADHLTGGRPVTHVAAVTGTDPDALRRLLRLLASRGIVREDAAGRFHVTAAGEALRSDAAVSARSGILMFTDEMFWRTTHALADCVRADRVPVERILGRPLDAYFAGDPDRQALFYDGIERVSDAENVLIARDYPFGEQGTVVDVGGRFGGLLLAVLREHPGLRGVLFDREHMLRRHRLDAPDLAGRWELVAGDFYVEVPAAEIYVIKRTFHVLTDEECVRVLRSCRAAMKPDGRVLVIDAIVPDGNETHQSKAMDVMMLAADTGRERDRAHLSRLFAAAELRLRRVIATAAPVSIAEAVAD